MAQFKVHNLIIVDASGSMTSIYEQALAGINETLSTIREEAKKSLLSTGNCKIINLSEENILWGFKI